MMEDDERDRLIGAIAGLMLSDNLGDVHEQLHRLRTLAGLSRLEGNFLNGWTEADWVGTPYEGEPDE